MSRLFVAAASLSTVCLLTAVAGMAAAAERDPNRPIRIVVPYPPGGSNDFLARLYSPKMTETLGQQIVVDNRGGANTIIDALSSVILKIAAMPQTKAALVKRGLDSFAATSGEIDALRREDRAINAKVIKTAGMNMQD